MAKIREIMEQDAYICNENDKVEDVLKYLAQKQVSGVPIVNASMKVVGFISDGDIMGFLSRKKTHIFDFYGDSGIVFDGDNLEKKLESLMEQNVMELATKRVVTVNANDEIDTVAEILSRKHIKKVPVLENGKLAGVVSRSTIVRHIMSHLIEVYDSI